MNAATAESAGGPKLPAAITRAMDEAFAIAAAAPFRPNPNPKVGCVILGPAGDVVGRGAHAGAGSAHAEVMALSAAGAAAAGGTAVVTLEPCNHIGRTGSCARALIDAGIRRVVFALSDPVDHGAARRGADELAAAGVDITGDADTARGRALLGTWLFAVEHQRPFVTWKVASSRDGFISSGPDTRVQFTGSAAMQDVQHLRAAVGAVVTGTGTVRVDNPRMTCRDASGADAPYQPLRVVIGVRDIPGDAAIIGTDGNFRHIRTHDVAAVLRSLAAEGINHVLLECGPALADAFLDAGAVDVIVWFTSPVVLGAGLAAATGFTAPAEAVPAGWEVAGVTALGEDTRHTLLPAVG